MRCFKFIILLFLGMNPMAQAEWQDVVLWQGSDGWQYVDVNWAFDAGNNWIWLPEANAWIYVVQSSGTVREWGPLEEVERTSDSVSVLVALLSRGPTTMAVWTERSGIWANLYLEGTGWSVPQPVISSYNGQPQAVINANGEVMVSGTDSGRYAFSRFYSPTTGWGPITPILDLGEEESFVYSGSYRRLTMDDSGRATYIWDRSGPGGGFNSPRAKFAHHYQPDTGWGERIEIGFPNKYGPVLQSSGNDSGHIIHVWVPTTGQLAANYHDPISGWQEPSIISEDMSYFKVAIDELGNALFVGWSGVSGSHTSRLYRPESGWGQELSVAAGNSLGAPKDLVSLPSGDFLAVWTLWDTSGYLVMYSNLFLSTGEWAFSEDVEVGRTLVNAGEPRVDLAVDSKGNAMVAWLYGRTLYYGWYDRAQGWGSINNLFLGGEFDDLYGGVAYAFVEFDSDDNVTIAIRVSVDNVGNIRSIRYE